MSDGSRETLARCVGDPQRFAEWVWSRRSQVHGSGIPASDLLSLEDVDRMITSSALRTPAFRLVRDGAPLPSPSYTTSGTIGGRRYDGLAAPAKVLAAMDRGATLVLQGAHRYHPPLARLCRDLEQALGHRCQVNAYVTPPDARGLSTHCDPHDVLVLQSFGTKVWEVGPTPWQRRHEPATVTVEHTLRPGDVQYLPRGTPHAARAQQSLSGHVTVGVVPTSWRDVLSRTLTDVLDDGLLDGVDDAIPAGWLDDQGRLDGPLTERLRRLSAVLRDVDCAQVAERMAQRFLASRPSLLAGAFVDRARLAGLDDGTRLVRRPGAVLRLASGAAPDRLRLLLGDRELDVPLWIQPAVAVVAARAELRPVDLADHLDPESRLVLCRRLVREGLLSPAP